MSIFRKFSHQILLLIIVSLVMPVSAAEELTNKDLYTYKAIVVDVYDGDNVTVDVDLGFYMWLHDQNMRLARINAPEVKGKEKVEGKAARDWLRERVLGKEVIIKTLLNKKEKEKKGKYGRYIIEVYLDGVNINDEIVEAGHAEYKSY